ncbi:Rho GTPase-activating protein 7 [Nymphon striatum]|nr:Rho GTPase-activating protein 7 [Nymphon striatum]
MVEELRTASSKVGLEINLKLEAAEACKWLKATGFPQYAQLYEQHQFPVDISAVQSDHYFLDEDAFQSLFRRLDTLNKCAKMKINNLPRQAAGTDSEEEDICALSENWMFTKSDRRWSRVNQEENEILTIVKEQKSTSSSPKSLHVPGSMEAHSSFDSVLTAEDHIGGSGCSPPSNVRGKLLSGHEIIIDHASPCVNDNCSSPADTPGTKRATRSLSAERSSSDEPIGNFHRSGSERFRDSAKALFRRVESFKSRRRKRTNGNESGNGDNFDNFVTFESGKNNKSNSTKHRLKPPTLVLGNVDFDEEITNANLTNTHPSKHKIHSKKSSGRRNFGNSVKKIDAEALSDSECSGATSPSVFPTYLVTDSNSNNASLLEQYWKASKLFPGGPINVTPKDGNESEDKRERISVYDNVPVVFFSKPSSIDKDDSELFEHLKVDDSVIDVDVSSEDVFTEEPSKYESLNVNQENSIIKQHERRDSGVGLSLSRPISAKRSSFDQISGHVSLDSLSAGQMMVLKKLSLLKLTALMERYSPSNRSGWSWAMPKFIKRIKSPDYKDKKVFGLPLLLVLQRTGQPLPKKIQSVIHSLRIVASESVGLFRKSGVRSRIQCLKNQTETRDDVNYENFQANDVADLLKQYFRELPEALLTNKLSETFISIFQYIPTEIRFEATQAAIFLMPDENREVLQTLLNFLYDVSQKASENQMTASNLAVCFAPSLFHMNVPRNSSNSPRRRKIVGIPDQKELKENKAAHECLTHMIADCQKLFSVSEDVIHQCRFSYSEHCNLVTTNHINKSNSETMSSWEKYVENCVSSLIKDTRPEKYLGNSKGWVPVSYPDNTTDLSYKKLGDGHHLKIWRITTEVEAPPVELLNKILRERTNFSDFQTGQIVGASPAGASVTEISPIVGATIGTVSKVMMVYTVEGKISSANHRSGRNSELDERDRSIFKDADIVPQTWDEHLDKWKIVQKVSRNTEIYQFGAKSMNSHPVCDFCVIRTWKTDMNRGGCALIEESINHPEAQIPQMEYED